MLHHRCTGAGTGRTWYTHRSLLRPAIGSRRSAVSCFAGSSPFKIQLRHPVKVADADERPLLVFLPGTDGTGQAIMPQLPGLLQSGYDVRTLYIPPDDRSGWDQLQAQTLYLISKALGARPGGPHNVQVTIVAESFGGCLALRLAAAAPQLVKALVLVNPATSYNQSLNGLSSFVAATNLLGLFPQDLYNTAQAVLLPFLVDIDRVGEEGARALRSMIFMDKPPDYETPATLQVRSFDDDEQEFESLTLAAERRRLQLSSAATFTTAGQQTTTAAATANYLDPNLNPNSPSSPRLGSAGRSRGRVMSTAAAAGVFRTAAGGAGLGGGSVFAPAAAANFRANLMRSGNLRDRVLKEVEVPCLIVSSAKDRMLPSLAEGARLARLLPNSRRVILPDSGHAALLERGMDLAAVMRGSGIISTTLGPTAAQSAAKVKPGTAAATRHSSGAGAAPPAAAAQTPVIIGVVKDEQAVPGLLGDDEVAPPRPATVFPSVTPAAAAGNGKEADSSQPAAAAAAARTPVGSAAGLDGNQASVSAGEAARTAATLAAAAATSAGGAASMAADADSSNSKAAAVAPSTGSNGNVRVPSKDERKQDSLSRVLSAASSNNGSSSSSGADKQQQQQQQVNGSGDKDLAWDQWSQYLAPWRDLVSPVLLGQEQLPGLVSSHRPLLFVGNHQKMGLYDMPLLAYELYMRGFKVKGLAHPGHWGGPLGPFFEQFGAVKAGPMTAFKLLRAGEQVLLFPGGAREVNKKVGQEYQLFWRESADFVRLAARCDAIIVPFAAVGADDAYDVMMEADELLQTPVLGDLVKGALAKVDPSLDPAEAALPLTRIPGLGLPTPVPVPNLQRLYFKICEPIDTRELGLSMRGDAEGWQQLYDGIKETVICGMQELLEVRAADDQRDVGARLSKTIQSWLPAFSITSLDSRSSSPVEQQDGSALRK